MSVAEYENQIAELKKRIAFLEQEKLNGLKAKGHKTVSAPTELEESFSKAEKLVNTYFSKLKMNPTKGSITVDGERYVLMRASSLSFDFLNKIKDLYSDKGEKEAVRIGQNFLFDISHVIGLEDAKTFHKKMNLTNPHDKLSAGPVHFAYSGWALVDIIEGSPTPDENFYLKFNHPYSFEASSWLDKDVKSEVTVCTMNSGYSSGWCEESYGIPLTTVEITCKAKGDDMCTFIMAPPHKIQLYLDKEKISSKIKSEYEIPLFFERKTAEQEILKSLQEKSVLLKEVHHRVKNNLQIISSLMNLQSHYLKDKESMVMFDETKNRIKAIALVHEKLYKSTDVEFVNFKEYVESIINLLQESFDFGIEIELEICEFINNKLKIEKAIPVGLILNELISNAIKHAFIHKLKGIVKVKISEIHGTYKIIVEDNGVGLPKNFTLNSVSSLGFEIILSLIDQLNGKIDFENNCGTKFIIEINE